MVHCWIESIFSFLSLFWKTKVKSEIRIGITFLIIGIFWCGFQHFVIRYKLFHFNSFLKPFHMIFKNHSCMKYIETCLMLYFIWSAWYHRLCPQNLIHSTFINIFQSVVWLLACWVILHAFSSSADFFQNQLFQKILQGIPSDCQTVWIQIRIGILLVPIWIQTVWKDYPQSTKVATSKEKVKDIRCYLIQYRFSH